MRKETIEVYKFEELSEEAKEKAYENFLNSDKEYFWMDENLESLKEGLDYFGFHLADYSIDYFNATNAYLKIDSQHYDGEEELEKVRLWKYLKNNYMEGSVVANTRYPNESNDLLSSSCTFTGYCMDETFLDPIKKFMNKPTDISFTELMKECAYEVMLGIEKDYEYQNSREFFEEEVSSNGYEFTEDGERYY